MTAIRSARRRVPPGRRKPHLAMRRVLPWWERLAWGVGGIVAVLVAWQIASDSGALSPLIFSSPTRIWDAFTVMVAKGTLWKPLGSSAVLFGAGLGASVLTGALIGAALGWSARAHAIFDPWVTILYAIPGIAFVPLLVIAFGTAFHTQVIIVWTVAVWPMIINVSAGVRTIERDHLMLARSYLARGPQVLWSIALPNALPFVLAGVKQAVALSLVGLVVAEYFVTITGIGGLILTTSQQLLTAQAYVGIVIIALAGLILSELLSRSERWLVPWRR